MSIFKNSLIKSVNNTDKNNKTINPPNNNYNKAIIFIIDSFLVLYVVKTKYYL